MQDHPRLRVRKAHSTATDARQAATELAEGLEQADANLVIVFCSPRYDLDVFGATLQERLACPVIGCTTAGEITSELGYIEGGVVGVSLASDELHIHPL